MIDEYGSQCSSSSQKTNQFKKQKRKRQLESRFVNIRKKMVDSSQHSESEQQKVKQNIIIERIIKDLQDGDNEGMFKLWNYCRSFTSFTESNIQALTTKMSNARYFGSGVNQNLTMGMWLIASWSSKVEKIQLDHSQLIILMVCLLRQNRQVKLSSYILYSLVNLVLFPHIRDKLLSLDIIGQFYKIFNLFVSQHMGILSFFLKNFLMSIPTKHLFDEQTVSCLQFFLKQIMPKCYQDKYMKLDCLYIFKRLCTLNEKKYTKSILDTMSQQIKYLIINLQNEKSYVARADIYDILTIVYKQNLSQQSHLMTDSVVQKIWRLTQCFLINGQEEISFHQQKEEYDNFNNTIWLFLSYFLAKEIKLKEQYYQWLKNQCMIEDSYQWECNALILLSKVMNFHSFLDLINLKMKKYLSLYQPTVSMLKSILNYLKDTRNQPLDSNNQNDLLLTIIELQDDQRQEISNLAYEIKILWKQREKSTSEVKVNKPTLYQDFTRRKEILQKQSPYWINRSKIKAHISITKQQ